MEHLIEQIWDLLAEIEILVQGYLKIWNNKIREVMYIVDYFALLHWKCFSWVGKG